MASWSLQMFEKTPVVKIPGQNHAHPTHYTRLPRAYPPKNPPTPAISVSRFFGDPKLSNEEEDMLMTSRNPTGSIAKVGAPESSCKWGEIYNPCKQGCFTSFIRPFIYRLYIYYLSYKLQPQVNPFIRPFIGGITPLIMIVGAHLVGVQDLVKYHKTEKTPIAFRRVCQMSCPPRKHTVDENGKPSS